MSTRRFLRAPLGAAAVLLAAASAGAQQSPAPTQDESRFAGVLATYDRIFKLDIELGTGVSSFYVLGERAGAPPLDPEWARRVNLLAEDPGLVFPAGMPEGGGACSVLSQHCSFNFESSIAQTVNVQAGIVQQEVAAASYTVPAVDFPIQFESAQVVWATANASVPTTTEFTFRIYDGRPNGNSVVEEFGSDGEIIPHIDLPVGTNAIIVQVITDPGDPIFINNLLGHNAYSIGWRIDKHNNQPGPGCGTPPPSNQNAFPCTDVDAGANPDAPTGNWINALTCPSNPCTGWYNFSFLFGLCSPSGDWNMRSSYISFGCNPATGACCNEGELTCEDTSLLECNALGGVFLGLDTTCATSQCPFGACCDPQTGICDQLSQNACEGTGFLYQGDGVDCSEVECAIGACCLPDASCVDGVGPNGCAELGGTFQTPNSECADIDCPESPVACCFESGCLDIFPSFCIGAGGTLGDVGSECGTFICFPEGACCLLDGSCVESLSPEECETLDGTFQGDGVTCAAANCPVPTGACCFPNDFCINLEESDCLSVGAEWLGPGTVCSAGICVEDTFPEDLNGDGSVGSADLNILLGSFGSGPGGDIDGDGDTDSADLNLLLAAFGTTG